MEKTYIDFLQSEMDRLKDSGEEYDVSLLKAPRLFKLLCGILDSDLLDRDSRLLTNAALGYFVNPNDMLPEDLYGLDGYMDDMYVACFALKILEKDYKNLILGLWDDSNYDETLALCLSRSERFLDEKNMKEKVLRYCGFSE